LEPKIIGGLNGGMVFILRGLTDGTSLAVYVPDTYNFQKGSFRYLVKMTHTEMFWRAMACTTSNMRELSLYTY